MSGRFRASWWLFAIGRNNIPRRRLRGPCLNGLNSRTRSFPLTRNRSFRRPSSSFTAPVSRPRGVDPQHFPVVNFPLHTKFEASRGNWIDRAKIDPAPVRRGDHAKPDDRNRPASSVLESLAHPAEHPSPGSILRSPDPDPRAITNLIDAIERVDHIEAEFHASQGSGLEAMG